jgi:hypothetical protein
MVASGQSCYQLPKQLSRDSFTLGLNRCPRCPRCPRSQLASRHFHLNASSHASTQNLDHFQIRPEYSRARTLRDHSIITRSLKISPCRRLPARHIRQKLVRGP